MSTNVEILSFSNTFFKYLCSFAWFDTDKQNALMKRYHIGSTEQGEQGDSQYSGMLMTNKR